MNNAVFGKTMENVRNRIDFELVTTQTNDKNDRIIKPSAKPRYKGSKIFSDNVVGVELHKSKVELNKPVITGFCILELSKVLMYDFHYNVIMKKYGSKCKLLFTDTDLLCYHIETDDVYEDLKSIKDQMDFSDYS